MASVVLSSKLVGEIELINDTIRLFLVYFFFIPVL